jgi:parallel beta-helix repeat protein
MSGWLIENNTVIDAQMGIMVGGGRDTIVRGNSFVNCDKALHIDNRGMTGEEGDCVAR